MMTHYELSSSLRKQLPIQPVDHPEKYYVYMIFESNNDGCQKIMRYVGKGKEFRAWQHFKTLSKLYADTVQRKTRKKISPMYMSLLKRILTGKKLTLEIFKDDLSESEAFDIEKKTIKIKGRVILRTGCLFNLAEGGKGIGGEYYDARSDYKTHEIDRKFENLGYHRREGSRFRPGKTERMHSNTVFKHN